MNVNDSCKIMEIYAVCPKCGCEFIGNGKGTLECDTETGYYKRTCGCGWEAEKKERAGTNKGGARSIKPAMALKCF